MLREAMKQTRHAMDVAPSSNLDKDYLVNKRGYIHRYTTYAQKHLRNVTPWNWIACLAASSFM